MSEMKGQKEKKKSISVREKPKFWIWGTLGLCVLAFVAILTIWNYLQLEWPDWTGFGSDSTVSKGIEETIQNGKITTIKRTTTEQFQSGKTLWDLLGLAGTLAVPFLIVVLGYLFQRWDQKKSKQQAAAADKEHAEQQAIEKEIAAADLREQALQTYLDRMSELLLDKDLSSSGKDDPVSDVARIRTLTVLRRLGKDGERKGWIIQFLYDAELLSRLDLTIADVTGAKLVFARMDGAYLKNFNLEKSDLSYTNLTQADLTNASMKDATLNYIILENAILKNANLENAALKNACLEGAVLHSANLKKAKLMGARLKDADLTEAFLNDANLEYANLENAILENADLNNAKLEGANLRNTNLIGAIDLTSEQVQAAQNWQQAKYDPYLREQLKLLPQPKLPTAD